MYETIPEFKSDADQFLLQFYARHVLCHWCHQVVIILLGNALTIVKPSLGEQSVGVKKNALIIIHLAGVYS